MAAPCPHRPPCPGCPRYGEPSLPEAARERLAALARAAGVAEPEVVAGERFGYRVRSRLMVRGRAEAPRVGLFEAGSHRAVDVARCRVHHPLVNHVAVVAREAIRATRTAPYDDRAHAGELRALQVVIERSTQRAQVVLVGNAKKPEPLAPLAEAMERTLGPVLHSLHWNGNPDRTNVILGPHWRRLHGPEAVRETIGGAAVFFPPGAFGQANLDLADRIVERVHAWVPARARVVELYAGCGPIGLGLLPRSASVTFVESAPASVRGLELGLAERPPGEGARARSVAADAGSVPELVRDADVVIVDPPRSGIDGAALDALVAAPPRTLIYLSCDLGTFEVQAARLQREGGMRLSALVAYDLFPNTAHVETLARFERAWLQAGSG
jgi:tRNA/tmRNA/rRNA uracil-C5-methylase (TrmA/RlmC/RlmD family)